MRRIRVILAVGVIMATLLGMAASPAMADTDNDLFFGVGNFNDGFCCNNLFFPTFGFSPFFDNRVVFDDVTFRNVRESSPRDDTCVLRTDGFFRTDDGLRCFF
jgi:hypothetical protein